jgi:hypothetical protein
MASNGAFSSTDIINKRAASTPRAAASTVGTTPTVQVLVVIDDDLIDVYLMEDYQILDS